MQKKKSENFQIDTEAVEEQVTTEMEHEVMDEHTIGQMKGEGTNKTEKRQHLTDYF